MKKAFLSAVVLSIIIASMFAALDPKMRAQAQVGETVIFQDDFESYGLDTFPSAGGWSVVWTGAGESYQVINDSYSHSPSRSLQVLGSPGWGVDVKKDFSSNSSVIGYEVWVMSTDYANGTDWIADVASLGFFNLPIVQWGQNYAEVCFEGRSIVVREMNLTLQPFAPHTWYKIRVVLDKISGLFNVWVNDVLEGQNLQEKNDPTEILSFQMGERWQSILTYYDDVKVFSVVDTTPPSISAPEQSPPDSIVKENQNVTVAVNITDLETGVYNATLWYGVNDTASWTPVNMTFVSVDTYQATIPAFANGTKISYKIIAYDLSGNQASNDNQGNYYLYIVPEFTYLLVLLPLMVVTVSAAVMFGKKEE